MLQQIKETMPIKSATQAFDKQPKSTDIGQVLAILPPADPLD
jgi:hypothetical protein